VDFFLRVIRRGSALRGGDNEDSTEKELGMSPASESAIVAPHPIECLAILVACVLQVTSAVLLLSGPHSALAATASTHSAFTVNTSTR
jgi:hypothetical protein